MSATTLVQLDTEIATLSPAASVEALANTIGKLEVAMRMAKEMKARLDEQLIEWIEANGEFSVGPVKYYVGTRKSTKCTNISRVVSASLGLSLDDLCALLAAQPFKPGACKTTLPPEIFEACFVTEETPELREGVAKKQLLTADTRFLPAR